MNNKWIVAVLALVVGFLGGMLVGNEKIGDAMDRDTEPEVHAHSHGTYEIPEGEPVPTVDLVVHEDPKGGYNAQILVTNFRFAPENVSTAHVSGEGHAHIYVDGVKINRVYGQWYHLGKLEEGTHEILVNLSGNDHSELLSDGEHIEDAETIVVGADNDSMEMKHESGEMHMEGDDHDYMKDEGVMMEKEDAA